MTDFKQVFLDTSPIIYVLDTGTTYTDITEQIFQKLFSQKTELFTSVVSIEEYLVYPYKQNDYGKIKRFFTFLDDNNISVVNIDKEIAIEAANFRAKYVGFKGMDALQLAAAFCQGADAFLTNDKQLLQCQEVNCVLIETFKKD